MKKEDIVMPDDGKVIIAKEDCSGIFRLAVYGSPGEALQAIVSDGVDFGDLTSGGDGCYSGGSLTQLHILPVREGEAAVNGRVCSFTDLSRIDGFCQNWPDESGTCRRVSAYIVYKKGSEFPFATFADHKNIEDLIDAIRDGRSISI